MAEVETRPKSEFNDVRNSIYLALHELLNKVLGRQYHFLDVSSPPTSEECWKKIEEKFATARSLVRAMGSEDSKRKLAIVQNCIVEVSKELTRWTLVKTDIGSDERDRQLIELTSLRNEIRDRALQWED